MAKMEAGRIGLQSSYRPGYVAVSPFTMQSSLNKQRGEKGDGSRGQMLLSFPATRAVLWDRRPLGESMIVHPTHYRNPSLVLEEKTLRLAHRFAQQSASDSYICFLLATVVSDAEGQGVCITVDRFESNEKIATGQLLDSVVIPCLVKKNSAKPKTSAEDYGEAIQNVCTRCYSKAKLDTQRFFALKAYCSYHENQQTFLFHLDFTLVTSGVRFKMTPVSPVPVVPTALSKNLSSPHSMSELQGEPKAGYLTMDQTRKLLLVLESDPKVDSLPLVGVWVSGVSQITHSFVWASCLRYLFNPYLKERVVVPPEAFLVVLYSPLRSKPMYYECVTTDGSMQLKFDLSACHEVMQLPKDTLSGSRSPYEMEMVTVENGEKMDAFEAALENNKSLMSPPKAKSVQHIAPDDITPRLGPMPQTRKAPDIQPSVPEVSLLLDENETYFAPRPIPQPMQMTHATSYPEPKHSKSKKKNSKQRNVVPPHSNTVSSQVNGYPHDPHMGSLTNTPHGYMPARVSPGYDVQQTNPDYMNPVQRYPGVPQSMLSPGSQPYQPPTSQPYQPPTSQPYQPPNNSVPYQQPNPQLPQQMNYPPYSQAVPYGYPPPVAGAQPLYAPGMYSNAPTQNIMWPQSNTVPPAVHQQAQTQLSASTVPGMAPPYGNQVPGYPQPYPHQGPPNQLHPGIPPMNLSQELPAVSINTSQQSQVPVVPGQMKSPILRPVRENSVLEDTVIKVSETTGVHISPPRAPSQQGSHQNSPQHHTSSSTDSGLHFSDNPDPDVNNTVETVKNSTASGQIHPDVYELLRMQDAQLKQLREQLSHLLSKQSAEQQSLASEATSRSSEATLQASNSEAKILQDMATQMSNQATPVKQKPESVSKRTCSAAVNTSLFYPEIEQARGGLPHNISQTGDLGLNLTLPDVSIQAGNISELNTSVQAHMMSLPVTQIPTSSMTQSSPRQGGEEGGTSESGDTMSFENFQSLQIQDRTQESIVSEMMVDMPAYTSMSPDKRSGSGYTDTDESNRSPMLGESVSMYERKLGEDDLMAGAAGEPTNTLLFKDQKQFYQNLMGNVQKLLGNTGMSEDMAPPDTPQQRHASENFNTSTGPYDPSFSQSTQQHMGHHHAGLNRSLSLPGHAGDRDQSSKRADPLRQSYPFDDVKGQTPINDDVGEKTRQQLEAMGIHLEKLNPVEKSRVLEHSSFFLDPSLLPKMQYVSMVLEGDNDMSAEADALAMKYLSDEQLTELAKMRMSSPGKFRRGREFDRILSPATPLKSNNNTIYGANHMSFATKKYLERYGLLENTSGEFNEAKAIPKAGVPTSNAVDSSEGIRVKDFLQSLQERSFNENAPPGAENNHFVLEHSHDSRENSAGSFQRIQADSTNGGYALDQDSFKIPTRVPSTPAAEPERQFLNVDRTPHIPTRIPDSVPNRQIFNNSAPHMPTEDNLHVFDKTPRAVQRNPEAAGRIVNNPEPRKKQEQKLSQVQNVLDIQRLKELPKLL